MKTQTTKELKRISNELRWLMRDKQMSRDTYEIISKASMDITKELKERGDKLTSERLPKGGIHFDVEDRDLRLGIEKVSSFAKTLQIDLLTKENKELKERVESLQKANEVKPIFNKPIGFESIDKEINLITKILNEKRIIPLEKENEILKQQLKESSAKVKSADNIHNRIIYIIDLCERNIQDMKNRNLIQRILNL